MSGLLRLVVKARTSGILDLCSGLTTDVVDVRFCGYCDVPDSQVSGMLGHKAHNDAPVTADLFADNDILALADP